MRFGPLALALLVTALPTLVQAQDAGLASDEQILLKQISTNKKAVYAENLGLTEEESAKFWPIYDEYEAKQKPLQDRFLANLNSFAEKYDTLTDEEATAILKEKMAIEKEGAALKQKYTAKIAKELPPKKALRYAQLETRVQNAVTRNVYTLIPLAR
jgi:Spy/CpxP family protein refolding chaperone